MGSKQLTSKVALCNAHQSLVNGPGDPTSVEGAKVNALESIAWSLLGLLVRDEAEKGAAVTDEQTIAQFIERALGAQEVRR